MTGRFWERLAAASGLLYVLLLNVGDDVIAKGEGPELTASRSEIVEHVGDHFDRSQFLLGRGVGLVGVALLVLFFVALRSVLRQGDPRPGWLPTVVLAGGLLAVAAQLMAYAPHLVAHQMLGHGGLSPESAQLLYLASNGSSSCRGWATRSRSPPLPRRRSAAGRCRAGSAGAPRLSPAGSSQGF